MKRILLLVIGLTDSACAEEPLRINTLELNEVVPRVEIAFRILNQFEIDMFVYNPNSFSICIDQASWPEFGSRIGQVIRVWNQDGSQWRFIGPELFLLGSDPKEIKARTFVRTIFSLKGSFNPPTDFAEPYFITYTQRFTNCEN